MKLSMRAFTTTLALTSVASTAAAFMPTTTSNRMATTTTLRSSQSIVTGPQGKPASSAEEDLRLTLLLIMDHEARSTTATKEQFLVQMQEQKEAEKLPPIDVSIPYDAAAQLAYAASDQSIPYDQFKVQYEAEAVALVKSKRPVDLRIPYDAAARLAYAASDRSIPYDQFKIKYEADAVALVKSKRPVDLSIPYDAAARLAYAASDRSMPYDKFKVQYEADAVAQVIAKRPKPAAAAPVAAAAATVDLSIPYDAAARLAYAASDKSTPYEAFKVQYEADAVAQVQAKQQARKAAAATVAQA